MRLSSPHFSSFNHKLKKQGAMASIIKQSKSEQQREMEKASGIAPEPVQSKIKTFNAFAPPALAKKSAVPGSKRKRSITTNAEIILAKDLDPAQILFHRIYKGKESKMRTVTMSPLKYKNPKTRVPVYIQLNGGGRIPFAIEANQYGTYNATFSMDCAEETAALANLDKTILEIAKGMRGVWWPKEKLSDDVIEDRYRPLVRVGKEKDDGTTWESSISAKIPINLNTGEPNACKLNGRTKVCRLIDSDDAIVSMYDLHGRSWKSVVIAISGLYFQSDKWGIGPKSLSIVKLQHDFEAEADYQTVDLRDDEDEPSAKKGRGCPSETGVLAQDPDQNLILGGTVLY